MRFDWRQFCERNNIRFVTSGPNTASNNISIQCPWCGSADQGNHMGLSLDKNKPSWGCFRNSAHRGRSPAYLIAALLHINMRAAQSLIGNDNHLVDDFDTVLSRLAKKDDDMPPSVPKGRSVRPFPKEFRDLGDRAKRAYRDRFIDYLANTRGFGALAAEDLSQQYFLYYAITGDQAWRLIFPIADIGWTGRAIGRSATLRYKEHDGSKKDEILTLPRAFEERTPPSILAINEGPLDALKIDYYGHAFGIQAIATMGVAVTTEQVMKLRLMMQEPHIRYVFILFDQETTQQTMQLQDALTAGTKVPVKFVPPMEGYKDMGEYSPTDATTFCKYLQNIARGLHLN